MRFSNIKIIGGRRVFRERHTRGRFLHAATNDRNNLHVGAGSAKLSRRYAFVSAWHFLLRYFLPISRPWSCLRPVRVVNRADCRARDEEELDTQVIGA